MKRFNAGLLAVMVALNLGIPVGLAQDATIAVDPQAGSEKAAEIPSNDGVSATNALETAIKVAKSKFTIPEGFSNFNSNIEGNGNRLFYRLNWSSDEGSINISIDSKNNVVGYEDYRSNEQNNRIPSLSREEGLKKAREIINNICPDISNELKYDKNNRFGEDYRYGYNYSFSRVHNEIPFYNNYVRVSINYANGELLSFDRSWNDVEFPEPTGIISNEEAQKKYKENIGIELKYKIKNDYVSPSAYLAYSPKGGFKGNAVEAFTGKGIMAGIYYNSNFLYSRSDEYILGESAKDSGGFTIESIKLSPQEIEEVDRVDSLVTTEDAEKYVRGISELGISEDATLENYNYSKNRANGECSLNLNFTKEANKEDMNLPEEKIKVLSAAGELKNRFYITIDAKTKEIQRFYCNGGYRYNDKDEYTDEDKEAAKKIADEFLKNYKSEKFNQSIYKEASKYDINDNHKSNFQYLRKVNDIIVDKNRLNVDVDIKNGKILNYDENWLDIEFPEPKDIIDLEAAYKNLFDKCGLELSYVIENDAQNALNGKSQEVKPKLAYILKPSKPQNVDSKTGVLLDEHGVVYEENDFAGFDDIANHDAKEEISRFLEAGYLIKEKSFKPDSKVTQKYFLNMLMKTRRGDVYGISEKLSQRDTDVIYRNMIGEGILDENEKNPDGEVTNEQSVKFILRYMGLKQFAELKDIFVCDFKDAGDIAENARNYAAIAKGLKMYEGVDGYFNPKNTISKAESVVMLYKLLAGW